ncbi:MAG: hypothetical protein SPF56_00170 [Bacteroidaceae bacterium]|nr:hypothetical protein [Bacteroidaceae bacterium]
MATRRLTIALLSIFLSMVAFAANKDLDKDITMVSYEQGWLDSSGTLALKNNSCEEVKNVVFLITYLDMSGNELDYEEFTRRVSIAPGMTKKLDIPAYEHERSYHYYKSENRPSGSPAFKVKFQLKDYNVEKETTESIDDVPFGRYDYERSTGNEGMYLIIAIVGLLFFIGITVGLYVLVAVMAQKRNRSVVVWVLLSLLATPLLMIIILLAIGKNEDYVENHYDRE